MEKLYFQEAIVVEGRYDKNTLSQIVGSLILETKGFGLFRDKELMVLLRQLARERGLIVFTDGDGAGFVIRNHIISSIPKEQLKHAYIPDIYGKERRKVEQSKEGKLGVEGMSPEILREALLACVPTEGEEPKGDEISTADLMAWGLTGGEGSVERREALLVSLGLPRRMTKKGLLSLLNTCYTREKVEGVLLGLEEEGKKRVSSCGVIV